MEVKMKYVSVMELNEEISEDWYNDFRLYDMAVEDILGEIDRDEDSETQNCNYYICEVNDE